MNDRTPRTSDDIGVFHDESLPEQGGLSVTGHVAEQAALYGVTPERGDRDPRDVWFNLGQPIPADAEAGPGIARAFQQIDEGIELILETVAPDGFQMADEREELLWGLTNVFHAQMQRLDRQSRTLEQEIRTSMAAQDGSDSATLDPESETHRPGAFELETMTGRLDAAVEKRHLFEVFRDHAGDAYFHHTGNHWEPRGGSRASRAGGVAPRIDSRDFIRAREAPGGRADMPEGAVVAVTGGLNGPDMDTVFETLDRVRAAHPDMILAHGGAPGMQDLASKWARARNVEQVVFRPDFEKHGRKAAIPRRDEDILKAGPALVVSFTVPGDRPPRLHTGAIEKGIRLEHVAGSAQARKPAPVVQFRGADAGNPAGEAAARAIPLRARLVRSPVRRFRGGFGRSGQLHRHGRAGMPGPRPKPGRVSCGTSSTGSTGRSPGAAAFGTRPTASPGTSSGWTPNRISRRSRPTGSRKRPSGSSGRTTTCSCSRTSGPNSPATTRNRPARTGLPGLLAPPARTPSPRPWRRRTGCWTRSTASATASTSPKAR